MSMVLAVLLTFVLSPACAAPVAPRGYDVHITRARHWTESNANPIALQEWLTYVRSDSEMRLDSTAETTTAAGERLVYRGPGIAVWSPFVVNGAHGDYAWFIYGDGEVTTKNPDPAILRKAYRIAVALKAQLQGDDGELYGARGEVVSH